MRLMKKLSMWTHSRFAREEGPMRGGPTAGQLESPSGLDVRDLLSSKTSASAITTIQELESDGEARIPVVPFLLIRCAKPHYIRGSRAATSIPQLKGGLVAPTSHPSSADTAHERGAWAWGGRLKLALSSDNSTLFAFHASDALAPPPATGMNSSDTA